LLDAINQEGGSHLLCCMGCIETDGWLSVELSAASLLVFVLDVPLSGSLFFVYLVYMPDIHRPPGQPAQRANRNKSLKDV
jgi:hypothetical protein